MLLLFVNTLALAVPAGLVWTTLYGCLRRLDGRPAVAGLLSWSAAGVAVAVGMAVARRMTAWINNELASLVLLGLALAFEVLLLAWLWRPRPAGDAGAERGAEPEVGWRRLRAGPVLGFLLVLTALPDIVLLSAGIPEPGAALTSSEVVLNLAGYLFGLTVAVIACWAVYRAWAGGSADVMRAATTAVIGIAMLGHATTLVQILLARRLIPAPGWLFQPVAWLINHEEWLTYALLALVLVPAVSAWRLGRARSAGPFVNPAERRLVHAGLISRRRFLTITGAAFATTVLSGTIGRVVAEAEPTLSPPEELQVSDDDVWVEVSRVADGHLHRFAYQTASDVTVRFIVVRKSAQAFGVGLDACQICGPSGYYESGGRVICLRCGVAMNILTIGFKGGCNPIPIEYTVSDGRLLVARSVLEESAGVFA